MIVKMRASEVGVGHTIISTSPKKLKVYTIEKKGNMIIFRNQLGLSQIAMKDDYVKVLYAERKKYSFVHDKNGDPRKLKNI